MLRHTSVIILQACRCGVLQSESRFIAIAHVKLPQDNLLYSNFSSSVMSTKLVHTTVINKPHNNNTLTPIKTDDLAIRLHHFNSFPPVSNVPYKILLKASAMINIKTCCVYTTLNHDQETGVHIRQRGPVESIQ